MLKIAVAAAVFCSLAAATPPFTLWHDHLGSPDSAQYSALKQIDKTNVSSLEQVWFYPSGDNGFRYGFNPIVVDGVLYRLGMHNAVTAVDAATGKLISSHATWARRRAASLIAALPTGNRRTERIGAFSSPQAIFCKLSMRVPASRSCLSATTERLISE
jgi:hypothetical protein